MVDVVFADVAQPDQARIVGHNAQYFLKNGGYAVISIKANCIDSTAKAEAVFASEIKKLQTMDFKPIEYVTLEPYERDHAVVCCLHTLGPALICVVRLSLSTVRPRNKAFQAVYGMP